MTTYLCSRLFKHLTIAFFPVLLSWTAWSQSNCTDHTDNNGNGLVTFNVSNTNADAIILTDISTLIDAGAAGTNTFTLYYNTAAINSSGSAWTQGAIGDGLNGWQIAGSATVTMSAGPTPQQIITGMTVIIPGGSTFGFALSATVTISYETLTEGAGVNNFANNGVVLQTGDNIGWGGAAANPSSTPVNYPRGWIGCIGWMPATPCSGAPSGGTAVSNVANACPSDPFTLSLEDATLGAGITYQWYGSPSGTGNFTAIAGATSLSYTTTISQAMDYYCEITCINSSQTSTSTTVTVGINNWMDCYCIPTYLYGSNNDMITNVSTGTLNDNPPINTAPFYFDRTSVQNAIPDFYQGESNMVSITFGGDGSQYSGVWVDFDHSGSFETNEFFTTGTNAGGGGTALVSVLVPTTALIGQTRMRIRGADDSQPSATQPCGPSNSNWGEGLDYYINIIPMPDCSSMTFPAAANATAAPQSLCVSGDINLNIDTSMPIATGITYQWQTSATETGTYTNIGTAAINPDYVYNSSVSGWYRCQILCNGAPVLTTAATYVEAVIPATPVFTDGQSCGPGEVTLSGTVSSGNIFWYTAPSGGAPVSTGNTYITPPLSATTTYYASAGASPAIDTFVGTGTNASTDAVSPFYYVWGGYKHQYMILASELQALGIQAGSISQIGVYVVPTSPATTYNNFSISMGSTTATNMSTYQPVTEVMYPTTVSLTGNAVNMFVFDVPFIWDGSSNIVIQTCFSNQTYGGTSVPVRYHTTTFSSHRYNYADNTPVEDICSNPSGTASQSSRPNFYISIAGCESERQPVVAYIRDTPVVNLGPDESLCGDANQSLTLDAGNAGSTFLWDDGSTQQTRTVTQSGIYYVTVTNEFGCSSSDTTHKDILLAPVVNIGPSDTIICNGVTLELDAGDDGTTYYWNTGEASRTIEVNENGSYIVIVTNDLGCTIMDTINVTVSGEIPSIDAILVDNIGLYTFDFQAFNPQGSIEEYTWDFGDGTPASHVISPTHSYSNPGNYLVTLTLGTSYCGLVVYTTSIHIVGINDIAIDDAVLNVYPNPAKNNITIENRGMISMEELTITNVLGQVVYQQKAQNRAMHQVDLSGFTSGLYSIRIKTDKGYVIRKFEVIK